MADAQAVTDKINQELAEAPQKIEDELDNFNKTLKNNNGEKCITKG